MDLFDNGPRILVEDAEGGIRYWPEFLPPALAHTWFQQLRDGCHWQSARRPMYDRVVDVPRLLAWYALHELPAGLPLGPMLERVQAMAPGGYTSVGLNLYRDGNDSVAMHNDTLHQLVPGQPLALVSLGGARRMNIRAKAGGRAFGVDLEPGSLLVMSHASQTTHEHGIPKTTRPVPPRMSVVFRARPEVPQARDPWQVARAAEARSTPAPSGPQAQQRRTGRSAHGPQPSLPSPQGRAPGGRAA